MNVLLSTKLTQNHTLNAWMVIDPSGSHLFWTTSPSTIIYYIEIATKTQNILVDMATYFTDSGSVNQHINGIGISPNGTEFYVSDGISTIYRFNIIDFTVSHISNCVVNSTSLGDIDGSLGVFLWSDAGTGSIYECNNDCNNCNTSVLIDTNDLSPWQFITGTNIETVFTGTGTFDNLISHESSFYWIDTQAQKIMQNSTSDPTDLVYQPAAALTFVGMYICKRNI